MVNPTPQSLKERLDTNRRFSAGYAVIARAYDNLQWPVRSRPQRKPYPKGVVSYQDGSAGKWHLDWAGISGSYDRTKVPVAVTMNSVNQGALYHAVQNGLRSAFMSDDDLQTVGLKVRTFQESRAAYLKAALLGMYALDAFCDDELVGSLNKGLAQRRGLIPRTGKNFNSDDIVGDVFLDTVLQVAREETGINFPSTR